MRYSICVRVWLTIASSMISDRLANSSLIFRKYDTVTNF